MKASLILFLVLSFLQMMNAIPVTKRQSSLTFNLPTSKTKWVIGRTESIVWDSQNNDSVDILLSQDESSDVIVIAQDINMFQGSYVWTVPDSVEPSTHWKIIIKNTNNVFISSDVFEIVSASSSNIPYEYPPSNQALNDNHWTASANITLIQPTGQVNQGSSEPLLANNGATFTSDANPHLHRSSFNMTLMITLILLSMTCFSFF